MADHSAASSTTDHPSADPPAHRVNEHGVPVRPTAVRAARGLLLGAGALLVIVYLVVLVSPSLMVAGGVTVLLQPSGLGFGSMLLFLASPLVKFLAVLLVGGMAGCYVLCAFLIFTGHHRARVWATVASAASMPFFAAPAPTLLLFIPLISLGALLSMWLPSASAYMRAAAAYKASFVSGSLRPAPAAVC
ncbi:hypothetical protein [Zhihengliuella flava]|uniref:Uncharacterized protein n=1 Tax=Zhihengliuella flava TaxID=1285193 RepID=A0A931GEI2_9MICC|nr:hypothetical protein [Zhihengliuella flava]MBG6084140.1 hypothetical protein [Zhihengliuella flava]